MRLRIFLSLFILWGITSHAQIRFEVEVPSSVDINEPYFQIRYHINTSETSHLTSPSFAGFDLLAGPSVSTQQSFSSVNGHSSSNSSSTFTYTLAPQKKGQFTIPPVSVQVNGKTYHSRSVSIKVTGSGQRQSSSSSARPERTEQLRRAGSAVTDKDLYIMADTRKSTVYEQEAVLVTYKFYERPGVGLNSIALSKKPDFKGVVSQDIPVKNIDATVENINGKSYRTGMVQQYLIFPQQAGEITLPGITFDCVVIQRDNSMDLFDAFFNGGGNVGKSLKRTAPEKKLTVKPLPSPKPAGFSGGVGKFSIKGEFLSPEARTNEPATFRLTVTGTGNLRLISPPVLQLPSDFETYPPKTTDKTETTRNGISGSMIIDYTFMPRKTGEYDLPSIRFIYFDPQSEKYESAVLPAQHITVKKGERSDEDVERELKLRGCDIRGIKSGVSGGNLHFGSRWWNTLPYWSCFAGLIILALFIFSRLQSIILRHSDTVSFKRSKAGKTATKRLKQAGTLLHDNHSADFYTMLSRTLHGYAADKFGIDMSELNQERIGDEMQRAGIPDELKEAFTRAMETCEQARFAPQMLESSSEEFLHSVTQLLNAIETASNKKKQ